MKEDIREGIEQKTNPVKAIRAKCLDCVCDSVIEVAECRIKTCQLWPFRMGHNPYRSKREQSEEQKSASLARLAAARDRKKPR